MESILQQLSESVTAPGSVEELARPLLKLLTQVTGLESAYLTSIDEESALQSVTCAVNTGELHIPAGLRVPWSDTLCKRCLDEGRRYTANVGESWPDSQPARLLGITSYASAPVLGSHGEVIGTLCAASRRQQDLRPDTHAALELFSSLIARHIERERLVTELRQANEYLTKFALTDSLTGLPNRRALRDELGRLLARAAREASYVIVGMIDLDDFKQINDTRGHAAGDAFLKACTRRLLNVARDTDMLARVGGDEFAIVGPGPTEQTQADSAAATFAARVANATKGKYQLGENEIDYAGVSAGIVAVRFVSVDQALELADAAMYRRKQARKQTRQTAGNE